MLATYWPFGAGIAIFLGLAFVVIKLIRRKGEGADLLEREGEEKRQSGSTFSIGEEDFGSRWRGIKWGTVVPILISVVAILFALFSGLIHPIAYI
mgnify:FL=1